MSTRTNKLLTLVIVMQALSLAGSWLSNGSVSVMPTAYGQVPDGGAQRQAMVDELKNTNAKLDRIAAILESGKLQVRTMAADEKR
jgi:hypothetical protein